MSCNCDDVHPAASSGEQDDAVIEKFESVVMCPELTSVTGVRKKKVLVGVCAMSKKSGSKPMQEILSRLESFDNLETVVFSDDSILNCPVEEWPIVDCLISFHSTGFPLEKAIEYSNLCKPYIVNNMDVQYALQDRRKIYKMLEDEGIRLPRYAILDRNSTDGQNELIECDDHIEVNGVVFNKPFVEKPISAEEHDVRIYYPTSAGGGSQRLFRKIGSCSSIYSCESKVRKTGCFIYEEYLPTDGTDVKVYTVGPDYAHAEARKSPALDGKVERDHDGKEVRYPIILTAVEKKIARKVCLAFKQTVCGFDLLRANGKSYVCDVNGFSFVKNSQKYYDDCARILGNMILHELAPALGIPWTISSQLDDPPIVPTTFGKMMELRCVVGVIRHGDRTPKQKMKMEVRHPKFMKLFEKHGGTAEEHVKLKKPKQLQEVLDIARFLLNESHTSLTNDKEIEVKRGKLEQLRSVLEMYGYFSGINRKVQLKYQAKGVAPRRSSSDEVSSNGISEDEAHEPALLLILKWGGELTAVGRDQAEELGKTYRTMYPEGHGEHSAAGTQGLGLLRLHSTFRHDLKIYASDEGRVQMTAAAFAKGLLALEGELTPILVQLVKSAHTKGLLDNDCESDKVQRQAKKTLHELMQQDKTLTTEDCEEINPTNSISIANALAFIKNPVRCCKVVLELIRKLLVVIKVKDGQTQSTRTLYDGESWNLLARRWGKLEKDFQTKTGFDISKIPDIYDCIKYDIQHNLHGIGFDLAEELFTYAKNLADVVIPQEYGISEQDKLAIGQGICCPLLRKIRTDLQRNVVEDEDEPDDEAAKESSSRPNSSCSHGASSPGRNIRTRLYFTSESHIHALLTMIRFGGLTANSSGTTSAEDDQWKRAIESISSVSELNYLTQIVIKLYEDTTKELSSKERFHIELHFSPGVNCCVKRHFPPMSVDISPNISENSQEHVVPSIQEAKTSEAESENSEAGNADADGTTVESQLNSMTLQPASPEVVSRDTEIQPVELQSETLTTSEQQGAEHSERFPTIHPLETLHDDLSLAEFDSFLERNMCAQYKPSQITQSCYVVGMEPGSLCNRGMDATMKNLLRMLSSTDSSSTAVWGKNCDSSKNFFELRPVCATLGDQHQGSICSRLQVRQRQTATDFHHFLIHPLTDLFYFGFAPGETSFGSIIQILPFVTDGWLERRGSNALLAISMENAARVQRELDSETPTCAPFSSVEDILPFIIQGTVALQVEHRDIDPIVPLSSSEILTGAELETTWDEMALPGRVTRNSSFTSAQRMASEDYKKLYGENSAGPSTARIRTPEELTLIDLMLPVALKSSSELTRTSEDVQPSSHDSAEQN